MTSAAKTTLTVQATINAPLETVWKKWTTPDDIVKWNQAILDHFKKFVEDENNQLGSRS